MDPKTMFLLAQEKAAERQREAHDERLAHLVRTRPAEPSPIDGMLTLAAVRRLVESARERARTALEARADGDCEEAL